MQCWRGAASAVILGALALAAVSRPGAGAPAVPEPPAPEARPPLPPPRPDRPAEASPGLDGAAATPLPPPRPDAPMAGPSPAAAEPSAEASACHERLQRLGVRFEVRAPLQEGVCGAPDPIVLQALPDGVEVPPGATMTCPVAEALARWTLDSLGPQAQQSFGEPPTRLLIGTSYQCRDQRSGTKPSEHAFANAVDVAGFMIGRNHNVPVAAHPDGSPEAAFQAAVRQAACTYFTTVLGPGQPDHADHLHLDLRGRNGRYRICQ